MKRFKFFLFVAFLILPFKDTKAQSSRLMNRKGNEVYTQGKFEEAEKYYSRALQKNESLIEASYNLGLSYYKQGKFRQALIQYKNIVNLATDKEVLSKSYHNLGNSYLKLNLIQESITAYQNALKSNPKDEESRYNLIYAMRLLKKNQSKESKENSKSTKSLLDKMEKEEQNSQQYMRRNKNLGKKVKNW